MAANNGQAEFYGMGDQQLGVDDELVAVARSKEDASVGDIVDSKQKFECLHCSKSYTTKKSLKRHLNSTDTACAKQRLTQEQTSKNASRPRWACSRCSKDCTTNHSVERHISNSCWRNCDECVADGVTRCDSVTKTGPCRTCEAKERSCTKHTAPIPGTKPQPLTGPAVQPQRKILADEEAAFTSDQESAKRNISTSLNTDSTGAHKNRRKVPVDQQKIDHGLGRVVDPLGGQAYVPPQVKKAAVSDWLNKQPSKSASAAPTQEEQMQIFSPHMARAGSVQNYHTKQQPEKFLQPSHGFTRALPASAAFLQPQHSNGWPVSNHQQHTPLPPPFRTYQNMGYESKASPRSLNFPQLPSLGGAPSFTADPPVQLDRLFLQMQATRQQNQTHELDMARQFGPRIDMTLSPPFGLSGSLDLNEQDTSHAQIACTTPSFQHVTSTGLVQSDSVLILRVHSNTYDKNGQPVFSILRIRCNEAFGPRLGAYCINRGKEYGVHWMFVYCYQAGTHENPGQEMQITLTWDMTPADVKDDDFPGVFMRNLDTIYVMKAKHLAPVGIKEELNEGGAVQSPGPQVSHSEVDMINGETNFYQNSDVSRQWYQALEQDANHLRAACGGMKTTIIRQQKQIVAKDQEIAQQYRVIHELTDLSRQLRERMQRPPPDSMTQVCEQTLQTPDGHVARQRLDPLPQQQQQPPPQPPQQAKQQAVQQSSHQAPQQRPSVNPSAFVTKCEAVRDPQDRATQHPEPLQFPSFSAAFTIPEYAHQPNTNAAYNVLMQHHGRYYDVADTAAAENDVDEMDEE